MNFKKIKKDYPKAYKLANRYSGTGSWIVNRPFPKELPRWLYDFFDEQGIYGTIDWRFRNGVIEFSCSYQHAKISKYSSIFWFASRTLAEEELFTKEFEILNQKQ